MAGTQIEIDIAGLKQNVVRGVLFFCQSALNSIGLSMDIYNEPALGNDKLLVCVDGPLEAFTHRLNHVAQFGAAFCEALVEITGCKDSRYTDIFIKILKECKEHVNDHTHIMRAMKSSGIKIKTFVANLTPELEKIKSDPDCVDYLKIVVEELAIAIRLLHDIPLDQTLALIAADRAAEIYLKGKLKISKKKFPDLITEAERVGILNSTQALDLEKAHQIRNKCQHEGIDIDFYEAVEHIKTIIEVINHVVAK